MFVFILKIVKILISNETLKKETKKKENNNWLPQESHGCSCRLRAQFMR